MIYTYEAQHADIKSSLPAKVAGEAWSDVIEAASDLETLEKLIRAAPAPAATPQGQPTVMVHGLPNSR